jgi:hypothetical protein
MECMLHIRICSILTYYYTHIIVIMYYSEQVLSSWKLPIKSQVSSVRDFSVPAGEWSLKALSVTVSRSDILLAACVPQIHNPCHFQRCKQFPFWTISPESESLELHSAFIRTHLPGLEHPWNIVCYYKQRLMVTIPVWFPSCKYLNWVIFALLFLLHYMYILYITHSYNHFTLIFLF